jgi:heterodisulfide reductase subunit C
VLEETEMAQGVSRQPYRHGVENISFKARVEELSGQNLNLCYQCGACSSGCPLSREMDLLPSKVMRLVQLGRDDPLSSRTIWICSTCFECEVRCPRGIDIASVMEALRQLMLRRKYSEVRLESLDPEELGRLPQIAVISNLRKMMA